MNSDNLKNIVAKGSLEAEDIIPFLSDTSLEKRLQSNSILAEYYISKKEFKKAEIYAERAFILAHYNLLYLEPYLITLYNLQKTDKARQLLKYAARKALEEKQFDRLIHIANQWQNVYRTAIGEDRVEYDFEILEMIQQAANETGANLQPVAENKSGKIKVGYLIFGVEHYNSVIVKLCRLYAEYHNRTEFDVYFIIPLPPSFFDDRPDAREFLEFLKKNNVKTILLPEQDGFVQPLLRLAAELRQEGLDILHTTAGLADFRYYFLICLRPARKIAGYMLGMMPIYAGPAMDIGLSIPEMRMRMECPLEVKILSFAPDLPTKDQKFSIDRAKLGFSEKDIILVSAGREIKYKNPDFWKLLNKILSSHKEVIFLAVGTGNTGRKMSEEFIGKENLPRLQVTDWISNSTDYINIADIYIDSFPKGGGMAVYEAMSLGKPFIAVKEDLATRFDGMNWQPISNTVFIDECFFAPNDLDGMAARISEWVESPEKRKAVAEKCARKIGEYISSKEEHVKQLEDIYKETLK